MTNETLPVENFFDPSTPDEQTEIGGLIASLRLARGFTLLFARCNQPDQRRRLVAIIRERLPHLNIQEIALREPIPHLLDELRYEIAEPTPDVIFVYGLEYSLPIAAQAANTPFVLNLNASRNSFSRYVPCPLVLWTPEYALNAIMHGAPDFFSVRSGVYFFMPPANVITYKAGLLTSPGHWEVNGLDRDAKMERVVTIRNLLQDYKTLPAEQRDFDVEARLSLTLARFYFALEEFSASTEMLEDCLSRWRQLGNLVAEANVLNNLGTIQQIKGQYDKARESLNLSLIIYKKLDDALGQAYVFSSIGDLYLRQGKYTEAEEYYKQALENYEQLKNREGQASGLLALGGAYREQGRTDEAEKMLHQALTIKRQLGDKSGEAYTLNGLGAVYADQGRYVEAEASIRQALSTFEALQMRINEGRMVDNLAALKFEQGDVEEAIHLGEKAVSILKDTQALAFLNTAEQHLSEWKQQLLSLTR